MIENRLTAELKYAIQFFIKASVDNLDSYEKSVDPFVVQKGQQGSNRG